jgi:hypothetical protein
MGNTAAGSDPPRGELIALSIPEVDQAARVITGCSRTPNQLKI